MQEKGAGSRWYFGNGGLMCHCTASVCGDERWSHYLCGNLDTGYDTGGYQSPDRGKKLKRNRGNIGNFLGTVLCVLAMSVLVLQYMEQVNLIQKKWEMVQISRAYILRMETKGYLSGEDARELVAELEQVEVEQISLEGTTRNPVDYGETIILKIRGVIGDEYEVEEQRSSTAKH